MGFKESGTWGATRFAGKFTVAAAGLAFLLPVFTAAAPAAVAAPEPSRLADVPDRTSISFHHSVTGAHAGTPNEHESRPGLSIVKLYLADYVFTHGTPEEKLQAEHMLRVSDDAIADKLYETYPQSVSETARAYGLADTHDSGYWGTATTSTYDSTRYLEIRKRDHGLADPILAALATAEPVAADGYRQDFGTAQLPGVIGTKWGWSNDRSLNASASFGPDFTVSAHTNGDAAQLTGDVLTAFDSAGGIGGAVDAPAEAAAPAHGSGEIPEPVKQAIQDAQEILP